MPTTNHPTTRNLRQGVTSRLRLREWDYSTPGFYFVTICTDGRISRFGSVSRGAFLPTAAGEMISAAWFGLAERFPTIALDAFCVMPNHVHGLIGNGLRGDEIREVGDDIRSVVQAFKSITTVDYGRGARTGRWPRYAGHLWQTGFHDHIVRNEGELSVLREYIVNNPLVWEKDMFFDEDLGGPL